MSTSDFLVIGSGVAGLLFALRAAETGTVSVVTKRGGSDTNTNMAQGGVSAVFDEDDSFDLHASDTIKCGAGLCREEVVDIAVRSGPDRIRDLVELGVEFTRENEHFALGREGGHSRKRIVFSADRTGQAIQNVLISHATKHPNIRFYQNHMAVGLILRRHVEPNAAARDGAVYGAYVLNVDMDEIEAFAARRTILSTGGAGKVYIYTSNPDVATGDGIAMAYRAGARVANLEFVQFHPTCLYHAQAKSFLLSETLRGEGGVLRRADGYAFMQDYDARKELAPRDVVARAIDSEMKAAGTKCAYLDMTHLDADRLRNRFPNIHERCLSFGIDITSEPIPVVPATHYFCGGVDVDSYGSTTLDNLLALGEVAHTGLHGANRLASNSLLEAVVFADRAAARLTENAVHKDVLPTPLAWHEVHPPKPTSPVIIDHDWDEARRLMWDFVGIVRTDERLEIAEQRMTQLQETVESLYWKCHLSQDLLELRNIVLVGLLVIRSARSRLESRGLHFTESHPERDDVAFARDTLLQADR
jgi:L-aspartate oxidase